MTDDDEVVIGTIEETENGFVIDLSALTDAPTDDEEDV